MFWRTKTKRNGPKRPWHFFPRILILCNSPRISWPRDARLRSNLAISAGSIDYIWMCQFRLDSPIFTKTNEYCHIFLCLRAWYMCDVLWEYPQPITYPTPLPPPAFWYHYSAISWIIVVKYKSCIQETGDPEKCRCNTYSSRPYLYLQSVFIPLTPTHPVPTTTLPEKHWSLESFTDSNKYNI